MNTNVDEIVEHLKKPYLVIVNLMIFLYIIIYLGLFYVEPFYIYYLSISTQIFVCLFLLYRFHPFRTHTLNKNDGSIIFASALFLLANTGITETILTKFNARTNLNIKI